MSIKNTVEIQRRTDLRKYKAVIARTQRSFVELGTALGMIRVQQLYKDEGYSTFESFVEAECDLSRSYAYRMIDAARVVQILSSGNVANGDKIKNESQARQLVPLGKDREAMVAVITAAEARAGRITADLLGHVRTELYPHIKVIDGELADPPPLVAATRAAIEGVAERQKEASGPAPTSPGGGTGEPDAGHDTPADGEPSTSTFAEETPAAGTGADPVGEADRPVPAVSPTDHRDLTPGDAADDASAKDVEGDEVQSEVSAPPSSENTSNSADRRERQAGSGVTEPAAPASGPVASPEPDDPDDQSASPRPAPAPSDPAALLDWLAERWEQVDADVSGPLLTGDDMAMLSASLNRIVLVFELLTNRYERARP